MAQNKEKIFFQSAGYLQLNSLLHQGKHSKIFILVDENTKLHCLPVFLEHFKHDFQLLEIPSGEEFKNIESTQFLWQKLTDFGADRKSLLINLGGGVVTDIGGFVALTFKRGLKFVNVPTTLLGMVDAAIGGKTGIDFNGLKNQIGIISLPEMVLIDSVYLKTLPKREFISGMAEVYKYGLIADEDLWSQLANSDLNAIDDSFIQKSAEIKDQIVTEDVNENGLRKILNFGHTLGHAIETHFLNKAENQRLLHGEAVAIGMIMASHLSHQILGLSKEKLDKITSVLLKGFPKIELDESDIQSALTLLKHDKKNYNHQINFVLIKDIGQAVYDCQVTENQIHNAISYYLKQ